MALDENIIVDGKYVRREPRFPDNSFVEIKDEGGKVQVKLLSVDRSRRGLCCIYGGDEPLSIDKQYVWEDDTSLSKVEVCWIKKIDENVFKTGIRLL